MIPKTNTSILHLNIDDGGGAFNRAISKDINIVQKYLLSNKLFSDFKENPNVFRKKYTLWSM